MRIIALVLFGLLLGCGAEGDETTLNFTTGEGNAGDPVIDSDCANSQDGCDQDIDSSVNE